MTEEEKKEFEEFLQWKKEKAEKEQKENSEKKTDNSEVKKEEAQTEEMVKEEEPLTTISEPENKEPIISPLMIIAATFVMMVVLIMLLLKCSNKSQIQKAEEEYVVADSIEEVVEVSPDPEYTPKTWDFTIKKDEMTDTKNIWATIQSDDYITQDFPYNGNTYATITVRYMKKYGYDVLVYITKGQINGRDYYGTDYVTARFDDGSPRKYRFDEAADGSSDHVFLRNSSDFISRCKKAKNIKIDIPIYQAGRPVFSFHVDEPLVWREE